MLNDTMKLQISLLDIGYYLDISLLVGLCYLTAQYKLDFSAFWLIVFIRITVGKSSFTEAFWQKQK